MSDPNSNDLIKFFSSHAASGSGSSSVKELKEFFVEEFKRREEEKRSEDVDPDALYVMQFGFPMPDPYHSSAISSVVLAWGLAEEGKSVLLVLCCESERQGSNIKRVASALLAGTASSESDVPSLLKIHFPDLQRSISEQIMKTCEDSVLYPEVVIISHAMDAHSEFFSIGRYLETSENAFKLAELASKNGICLVAAHIDCG